jgi:hypothetical protein
MSDIKFEQSKKLMQELEEIEDKIFELESIPENYNSEEIIKLKNLYSQKKHQLETITLGCGGKI